MILYFAANFGGPRDEDHLREQSGISNRLISFADTLGGQTSSLKVLDYWGERICNGHPHKVFLDSGAFSAWSRGVKINLQDYIRFVHERKHWLYEYANLDVIGDWKRSAYNLDIMLDAGLSPVAIYHRGSPWAELDRLASLGLPLALGGLVGKGRTQAPTVLKPYLDRCWRHLRDHWPIRVHVLGITARWVLERYPWFSSDSSAALVTAGLGQVQWWQGDRILKAHNIELAKQTLDGDIVDHISLNKGATGSAHTSRRIMNIKAQLRLEHHVTSVWAARGVTWDGKTYTGTR